MSGKRQARTFLDHVHELRRRLLASGVAFVVGGFLAYLVHVPILDYLHRPYRGELYYTSPAGAFNLAMKISLLGGIVFLLPVLAYNLISFVQPALTHQFSRRALRLIMLLTLVLAVGGGAFGYYAVVPMSLSFFSKFSTAGFQSLISASDYMSFIVNCIIAFVVIFQIPLLILLIDKITPLPPKRLIFYERHVIVASLLIALVLPFTYDPLTQFLIAAPMIALYNLSIILVLWAHRRRDPQDDAALTPLLSEENIRELIEVVAIKEPLRTPAHVSDLARTPPRRIVDVAASHRNRYSSKRRGYTERPPMRRGIAPPKHRYTSQLISDIVAPAAGQINSPAADAS